MAERNGDRVGRVIRSRHGGKIQDTANHFHNLLLFCPTVADHRLLDLQRRIFIDLQTAAISAEQGNAASLRNGYTGGDIRVKEKLLYCHAFRMKAADQLLHIGIDLIQTGRERRVSGGSDHTAVDKLLLIVYGIYDPKANCRNSRV